MSLNLPANFEKDIQGRDTNLVPVILIGNANQDNVSEWGDEFIYLSTGYVNNVPSLIDGSYTFLPTLLNIPSLKESIDIEKRNYKIS